MPLLVRLIDSEINLINLVVAEFSHCLDHLRLIRKQMRAGRVTINQKAPLPDLHVDPVHRYVQYTCEIVRTEKVWRMPPSRALLD